MENEIKEIADHYGYDMQSHKLIEEMGELSQALVEVYVDAKVKGYLSLNSLPDIPEDEISRDHLFEEIADVSICLSQVIYLLGGMDRINEWREKKIKRQMERIANEQREVSRSDG